MAVDPETVREVDAALDLYQYLQPVNAAEERERFLDAVDDGESYNPSYEYRSFDRSDAVQTALERLTETAETRLEERLVAGLRSRCRMVSAIGTPDITAASEHHYGAPRPDLVAAARELFTPPSEHGEASTGAETVVAMFNTLFDRLDVDYEAAAGDNDIIRNNPGASRILVPQGKSYSVAAAKRLLVHE
ncbi:MAG: hypothetical protein SVW77_02095, partial [Candidatus Nanohaloarchaea archaeon]|nr:hypothetical protein [Candidatus Nanohaloarchaea archaeon]